MESSETKFVTETKESFSLSDTNSSAQDTQESLVSLEVADDVKTTSRVPSAEQPVISLEPTDSVKSAISVQPTNIAPAVAATPSIDATISIDVPIAPPRRRKFRPHVKPIRLPAKVHTFDSFQYRDYRIIWGATFFFSGAFWLQMIVVGWLTFSLTQSALLTSIAMGLDALPILVAGPLGGMLVDSFDRRKLLIVNYVYQATLTLSFSAIVFLDKLQTWHIFGFVFLMGISWVINDPARMSIMSNVVPKKHLVNAFALNGLAFSSTRLVAPALGGAMLAVAGPGPVLLIQVTLQIAAALSALSMKMQPVERAKLRFKSTLSGMLDGIRYIKGERIVLGLMLFSAIPPVLVMPFAHGLIPVYAGEVFKVGPAELGFMMSALGAGSLIGTIALASFGSSWPRGRIIVGSLALTSIGMILFALNSSMTAAYPLIMLMSVGVMTFFATTIATVQSIVPDNFRGRVTGVYIITFGLMPLGSLTAGLIAERFGAPYATVIGSGLIIVVLLALALSFREVWRLK